MPNSTRSLTGGQELLRKIKQHLDGIDRRNRDAQGCVAHQHPAMIIIDGLVTKIKRCSAHIAAAIIKGEKESARQTRKTGLGTEPGVQPDHQWPDISGATANPGERRGDDIADSLVGVRRQKTRLAYRIDQAGGHRVGQAAELDTGARSQLQFAAAELLRNPAQPAERGTGRLTPRNPHPHQGTVLR
jgi:hypothetical protein